LSRANKIHLNPLVYFYRTEVLQFQIVHWPYNTASHTLDSKPATLTDCMHHLKLDSCNRNVNLKMVRLPAETCRWKYHN